MTKGRRGNKEAKKTKKKAPGHPALPAGTPPPGA